MRMKTIDNLLNVIEMIRFSFQLARLTVVSVVLTLRASLNDLTSSPYLVTVE